MFGSFLFSLVVAGIILASALSLWTLLVYKLGPGFVRRHAYGAALLAIFLVMVTPMAAHAAATFGQCVFTHGTGGVTNLTCKQRGRVLTYLTLTSAQTTSLRGIWGDVRTANGAASATFSDGTDTFPGCAPELGDLTD